MKKKTRRFTLFTSYYLACIVHRLARFDPRYISRVKSCKFLAHLPVPLKLKICTCLNENAILLSY